MARSVRACDDIAGDTLDQAGLENGADIVRDCLGHSEAMLALEHLLSLIKEPPLDISRDCHALVVTAGARLGLSQAVSAALRGRVLNTASPGHT